MRHICKIISAILRLLPLGMLSLCLVSCGTDKTSAPDPAETPVEEEPLPQEDPLSKAEEQALSGEFQLRADQRITEENAAEEAAKLEKEIEADLN